MEIGRYCFVIYEGKVLFEMTSRVKTQLGFMRSAYLAIVLLLTSAISAAVEPINKVKAAYLYQFTKFIHWSDERFASDSASLNICIVAAQAQDNELFKVLNEATLSRTSNGRAIHVAPIQVDWSAKVPTAEIQTRFQACHLVYLEQPSLEMAALLIDVLIDKGILIVSDQESLADSGIHGLLLVRNNRLVFFLNPQSLRSSALTVDATLLQLAKIMTSQERRP